MISRQLAVALRRLSQLSRIRPFPQSTPPCRLTWSSGGIRASGVRFNSTQSSSSGTNTSGRTSPLVFGLGAILGVALTYYATKSPSSATASQKSQLLDTCSGLNNAYGTPEDFQKAISELRAAFSDEHAVSTDPEDLHVHGFSDNDYHPGMLISAKY